MGYGGIINKAADPFGWGDPSPPKTPAPGKVGQDYLGLIQAFSQGAPTVFGMEQQWKPQYIAENVKNISTYGAPAVAAYRGADPEQAALSSAMTRDATVGIDAGSRLDPAQLRLSNQYTRAGQAARGLGFGPADAYQETGDATRMGVQLQNDRRDYAGRVSLLNQNTNAQALGALNAGPTIMPADQNYDIFNTAYNARSATSIAAANNEAAGNSY